MLELTAPDKRTGIDKESESTFSASEKSVIEKEIKAGNTRDPAAEMMRQRNTSGRDERHKKVFGY